MKRLLFAVLAAGLVITPLANCSSSSKDDCGDIARKACEKAQDCGFLAVPLNQCTDLLADVARQEGTTDAECRDEWESVEGMNCVQFFNYL